MPLLATQAGQSYNPAMNTTDMHNAFATIFPEIKSPRLLLARAPGRVNLIGEHTDYNAGFVCPMAINRLTTILAAPRTDALIRIHSVIAKETVEFPIDRPVPKAGPAWSLYAKGVAEGLRQRLPNPGTLRGINAVVDTTVPIGGGLSSSASFEVAVAHALLLANEISLPGEQIALAAQWAEHKYPGVPCGIMDQYISALARPGHVMLLDCRDLSTRHVPLDDPNIRIVISDSNVKHSLAGGEYAARRSQCEDAVRQLQTQFPTIATLRDVSPAMLDAARGHLDPIAHRRARHVVTEIHRTLDFAAALETRDYETCGKLMLDSHASLRDDYQVSCPELDTLVEIARNQPGVFGARMTGGGFGGSIVALVQAHAVEPLTQAIATQYPVKGGSTFYTDAAPGASAHWL